ncbi:hypothetical protein ACIBL6_06850 [Streptomyces sp. NPDC050400]|uniref:hypothetical protein n=1 Tax=Streptomyces sp. NPDC050400 TaxID=3365610 RepID=UPI0037A6F44E
MAGQGKKTSFDGMTHEQMLAWLDEADAGTVQAAADKLSAAAKEIHSIADELKVRPQWVKWKGDGADSFRQWAGKLANVTVAMGDYSQDTSKWLGQAATAIGKAKTSAPRDKGVDANIDAARSAHNDPDAQTILSKNMAVRQQTADELEKLGQAYSLSASQMAAARKPELLKFPPMPNDIQDPDAKTVYGSQDLGGGRGGASGGAVGGAPSIAGTGSAAHGAAASGAARPGAEAGVAPSVSGSAGAAAPVVPDAPTRMGIDSVDTLPPMTQQPTGSAPPAPPGPTAPNQTGPGLIPPAYGITGTPNQPARGGVPPVNGRPATGPTARGITGRPTAPGAPGLTGRPTGPGAPGLTGRPTGPGTPGANGRPTAPGVTGRPTGPGASNAYGRPTNTTGPGQSAAGAGRSTGSVQGRGPAQSGVTGGRQQPGAGRSTTGMPRGTVMGAEGNTRGTTGTRGPSAQPQSGISGRPTNPGSGSSRGTTQGRLSAGATGAKGVVGGSPSQQQRANSKAFSQGGSGLVRPQGGAGAGGEGSRNSGAGHGGAAPAGSRPGTRRDDQQGSDRPDYVTEDQETWQPDARRSVPSVVTDDTKSDER